MSDSILSRWRERAAAAPAGDAAGYVFERAKRDLGMRPELGIEQAIEHALSNWQTVEQMQREMRGAQPLSAAEVEAVRQKVVSMFPGGETTAASHGTVRSAKDAERDYSCVMVNVKDPDFVRKFSEVVGRIPEEDVYDPPGDDKFGREDKPHVTVKYGLHTENADDVRQLVSGFGPVEISLAGVSFFRKEGKDYDVLKFDVESGDLRRLREVVEGALECTDEHPEYKPHMTICYLKRGAAEKYADGKVFGDLAKSGLSGQKIVIDSVCFSDHGSEKVEIPLAKEKAASLADSWAKRKHSRGYETESETIRENKAKPEAEEPHDFKQAEWTHPNGHPRCLVCGGEEIVGGRCNVEPTAADFAEFEAELDEEFPGRAERREKREREAADKLSRGEVTYSDAVAIVAAGRRVDVVEAVEGRLIERLSDGLVTQAEVDAAVLRLRAGLVAA